MKYVFADMRRNLYCNQFHDNGKGESTEPSLLPNQNSVSAMSD